MVMPQVRQRQPALMASSGGGGGGGGGAGGDNNAPAVPSSGAGGTSGTVTTTTGCSISGGHGGGAGGGNNKVTRSQSYGTKLLRNLTELKTNDELCDFTVCAGGKLIQVHKILLAATSDYFRAMLQGPMRESTEAKVDLKSISARALEQIVDFIYSGEMRLDEENLIDILNAGSHLQIATVLELCSDYMINTLTFASADEYLQVADAYNLAKVTEAYNQKVLRNFEEFAATEQYLGLSLAKLEPYLGDDELRIKSESTLYELAGKWVAHDPVNRLECIEPLLRHVRFALFSKQQLLSLPQHWFTQMSAKNMSFIQKGLEYHQYGERAHPIQSTHLEEQSRVRACRPSLVLVHQGSSYRPFELVAYNVEEERFYQLVSDISSSRDCRMATIGNFLYECRSVDCGGGTLMNSLLRFDPRHLSLTELAPCRRLRIECALVVHNGCLYVFGGTSENPSTSWLDSVEYYDPKLNVWRDDDPMPAATHSHAGVSLGGVIYLAGGVAMPARAAATTTLHAYDPSARVWRRRADMHCARRLHEVVALGTAGFYVLGGIGDHNVHQQTQIPIERYDVAADQWTILTSTLAGRSVGHFVAYDGRILSIGREHQDATEDEIRQYDTAADAWTTFTKMRSRGKNSAPPAAATVLHVNFFDSKLTKRLIVEPKR